MNSILLSVGVAIVLALFAALVGPFLIDWNGYRHVFEARLSEMAGRPVTIGRIDELRLLPMPVFELADVHIEAAGGEGRRLVDAPALRARAALAPLLSGEVRIEEIVLDRPRIELDLDERGLALPAGAGSLPDVDPARVILNALEIRDGTVLVRDAGRGRVHRLDAVNLVGQATSLAGPFRAEGGAVFDEELYSFRLATGRLQDNGALRAKIGLAPADGSYEAALDGELSAPEGGLVFAGRMRLQRAPPADETAETAPAAVAGPDTAMPWRIEATVRADGARVGLERLAVALGAEGRRVQLDGAAELMLAPPARASARLAARQIDLDRAFGAGPGKAADASEVLAVVPALLARLRTVPIAVDFELAADAVLLNGALSEELLVRARLAGERLEISDLEALLPGRARLAWRGHAELGESGPKFAGAGSLHARQLGRLTQWLGEPAPRLGPLRLKTGDAALALEASMAFGPDGLSLNEVEARLDDMLVTGALAYKGAPARALRVRLAADRLDIDRYFDLVAGKPGGGAAREKGVPSRRLDIALDLIADEVAIGGVVARDLAADLAYDGGALTINRLSLGDVAGSSLTAKGRVADLFGRADGEITARLSSADPGEAIRLARELGLVAAGDEALLARAGALAPVELELDARAARAALGSSVRLNAKGALAGTRVSLAGRFDGALADLRRGDVTAELTAENPDGLALMAQLAGAAPDRPTGRAGKGSLSVSFDGRPETGGALSARLRAPGFAVDVDGTLAAAAETAGFDGSVALEAADARVLAAMAGIDLARAGDPAAISLSAMVSGAGTQWRVARLDGTAAGRPISGTLALAFDGEAPPRLEAELATERLDLAWLLAVLAGERTRLGAGTGWPEAPFSFSATRRLAGRLDIAAQRVELPWGESARDARIALQVSPGVLAVDRFSARLYGGELTLRGEIAGQEGGARFSADGALRGADVASAAWAPHAGAVASGRLDVSARVSGTGRSWLGLVSSLDGEGSFAAADGEMRGLSVAAFARTIEAARKGLDLTEDTVLAAFSGYLAAGRLPYRRFVGEFTIEDGLISARNIALDAPRANIRASALIDLPQRRIDSEWTLSPPDDLAAPGVPPVTLVFAGPLAAPQRDIDVHALAGYLAVRRMETELRRLEEAQADALERERLDRELAEIRRARRERAERERLEAEARERERLEAEARARERERLEAEKRAREAAPSGPSADSGKAREEGAATAGVEPAGTAGAPGDEAARDAARRKTLEELVEEVLREEAGGQTFSLPPPGGGDGTARPHTPRPIVPGALESRDLPPIRSDEPAPEPAREPAAEAEEGEPGPPVEAQAGQPREPGQTTAPYQPPPPAQKSIRLNVPDPLKGY